MARKVLFKGRVYLETGSTKALTQGNVFLETSGAAGEIFERILSEEISVADQGDRYADAIRAALDSISMLDSLEATSITPSVGRSLLATRVEVIYNRN